VFNHRFASADPLGIAFSGELLALVVVGGMRGLLGPAIGALFFILFREFLSIWTPNWLFWFGLLFVGFIVFSPTGLVGIAERVLRPFRPKAIEDAAMASRQATAPEPLPPTLRPADRIDGPILVAQGIAKHFGGIKAVQGVDIAVRDRSLHALIGPNGAGKTTAFNLISGMYVPDEGTVTLNGRSIAGLAPEKICAAGVGRSFQITNLFPTLSVEENVRLACQARHASRFNPWRDARAVADVRAETAEVMRYLGLAVSSGPKPARCPMAASASSTWASPWRRSRGCCSSTSRSPGLPPPSASASATSSSASHRTCPCSSSSTTSTGCSRSPMPSRS